MADVLTDEEIARYGTAFDTARALARIERDAALLRRCLRILATYDPDESIDGFWYPYGEPPPGVRNLRQLVADLKAGIEE